MAKKKKSSNTPRRKKMSRNARLQSAVHWLKTYDGKNVIHDYAKWYGQSEIGAIIELRMFGVSISEEVMLAAKEKVERKTEANRKAKEKKAQVNYFGEYPDSDDTFSYITGYTSGEAPYGVTWEE